MTFFKYEKNDSKETPETPLKIIFFKKSKKPFLDKRLRDTGN